MYDIRIRFSKAGNFYVIIREVGTQLDYHNEVIAKFKTYAGLMNYLNKHLDYLLKGCALISVPYQED